MSILSFEQPKKVLSTEAHNEKYSSDCEVPGTYVPNMSKEDMLKWKAKYIKGKEERIEIRKTFSGAHCYSQVLIKVFKSGKILMSMNGTTCMSFEDFEQLKIAIDEAKSML